jgi:hypothetical protein
VSASDYRWVPLPENFNPINATVKEVASYELCGRWLVHKRIRLGIYEAYSDGGRTKIIFASVKARRAAAIAASKNPTNKRRVGRPRKARPDGDLQAERHERVLAADIPIAESEG